MVAAHERARRVRVVLVDDSPDIRRLLRAMLRTDDRFDVVGEASDGREAIQVALAIQPDLIVLDRQMPVLGGLEALPEIRARAPRAAVVLYTAAGDAGVAEAAMSAGALGVVDKAATGPGLVDRLAEILVDHWAAPDATVEVRVGPVPASAAAAWVTNTRKILEAVRAHPDVVPGLRPDVLDVFGRFLDTWGELAESGGSDFVWVARAAADEVELLVEHWTMIDQLPDDELARLGCTWSGPEGTPFFVALSAAVLEALEAHAELRALAARLTAADWPRI